MSNREVEPVAGSGPAPTPVPTPALPGFLFLHSPGSPYKNPRVFGLPVGTLSRLPYASRTSTLRVSRPSLEGPFQFSRSESGSRLLTWKFEGTIPSFSLISRAGPLVSHLALDPLGRLLFSDFQTVPRVQSWVMDQRSGGLQLIGSQPIGQFPTFLLVDPLGRYLLAGIKEAVYSFVIQRSGELTPSARPVLNEIGRSGAFDRKGTYFYVRGSSQILGHVVANDGSLQRRPDLDIGLPHRVSHIALNAAHNALVFAGDSMVSWAQIQSDGRIEFSPESTVTLPDVTEIGSLLVHPGGQRAWVTAMSRSVGGTWIFPIGVFPEKPHLSLGSPLSLGNTEGSPGALAFLPM